MKFRSIKWIKGRPIYLWLSAPMVCFLSHPRFSVLSLQKLTHTPLPVTSNQPHIPVTCSPLTVFDCFTRLTHILQIWTTYLLPQGNFPKLVPVWYLSQLKIIRMNSLKISLPRRDTIGVFFRNDKICFTKITLPKLLVQLKDTVGNLVWYTL